MNDQLAAAMNVWRSQQTPPLEPVDAIQELLRIALVSEGVLPQNDNSAEEDSSVDALVAAFQHARESR